MSGVGGSCRNCGRPAGPRFCGFCGQALDDRRSPLLGLLRDLLDEWLSLDGRLFRTLAALPWPGRLTRLYLDGKRAPFLSPLRLYLLASVLLFSSLFALNAPNANDVNLSVAGQVVTGPQARSANITIMQDDDAMTRWANTRWADKMARLRARPPQELLDRLFAGLRSTISCCCSRCSARRCCWSCGGSKNQRPPCASHASARAVVRDASASVLRGRHR